jgi:hypothetical protein
MMSNEEMTLNQTKTLAERLSEGRMPVGEALKCATQLADSLRKLHDQGKAHGALTPSNVTLAAGGVELLPAAEGSAGTITPYTAPEVVQGHAADERSDIFSLGAVLFEMLTGRRAFDGESRVTLAANLTNAPTPSSGSPLVDRLVGPCLTKNPDMRSPRMQRVIMELKMLSVAARRADMGAAGERKRDATADIGSVREELQQLEARLAARLHVQEQSVSEMQRSASGTETSLKAQMAAMSGELATNLQQAAHRTAVELDTAATDAVLARVDKGLEALEGRIAQIERTVEELRGHTTQFERNMAADLVDLEQNIKVQSAAIESARTAMSQTDDLVERVVEALESLQMAVMDQSEGGEHSTLAVN